MGASQANLSVGLPLDDVEEDGVGHWSLQSDIRNKTKLLPNVFLLEGCWLSLLPELFFSLALLWSGSG